MPKILGRGISFSIALSPSLPHSTTSPLTTNHKPQTTTAMPQFTLSLCLYRYRYLDHCHGHGHCHYFFHHTTRCSPLYHSPEVVLPQYSTESTNHCISSSYGAHCHCHSLPPSPSPLPVLPRLHLSQQSRIHSCGLLMAMCCSSTRPRPVKLHHSVSDTPRISVI